MSYDSHGYSNNPESLGAWAPDESEGHTAQRAIGFSETASTAKASRAYESSADSPSRADETRTRSELGGCATSVAPPRSTPSDIGHDDGTVPRASLGLGTTPSRTTRSPHTVASAYSRGGGVQRRPQAEEDLTHRRADQPESRPALSENNVWGALTDVSFNEYATPGLARILYIVGCVFAILSVTALVTMSFVLGSRLDTGLGMMLGGFALLGGVSGFVLFIVALRVQLEVALAVVRTAKDIASLRARTTGSSQKSSA